MFMSELRLSIGRLLCQHHKTYSHRFITLRLNHCSHVDYLMMSLIPFWTSKGNDVAAYGMCGSDTLGFHKKYLNLCSEDKRMSWDDMRVSN